MAVASHLRIQLADYDARIRTFIPVYDELLGAAVDALHALNAVSPHIVDCGTGTGALSVRCLRAFADERLAELERNAWRQHLRQTYSDDETDGHFAAWAGEDMYFSLASELDMLASAGLLPDVVWRRGPFAVIAARTT